MNNLKRNIQAFSIAQILLWVMLCLLPPILTLGSDHSLPQTWNAVKTSLFFQAPLIILYFLNFYVVVPFFLFKREKLQEFILANLLLIVLSNLYYFLPLSKLPQDTQNVIWPIVFGSTFFHCLIITCATGMRYVLRWQEMELHRQEESRKTTEAELVWLKNQLNPHFLFNTLNNISSLVQVDADLAQESLGQLSDLLRYALYESNQEQVPLANELEFMRNYIDLMRLRYNETTEIRVDFPDPAPNVTIIPLLFISPIENAFKHGVNNRYASFVHIRLTWENEAILFAIENSRHPNVGAPDRVGSGIGIENLRRRLELAYPGRHTYQQTSNENCYQVNITIKP